MTGTRQLIPALMVAGLLAGCTAANTAPSPLNPASDYQQDVSGLPDYALDDVPTTPVSPQFVLEHRSALDGQTIRIRGTVVRMIGSDFVATGGGFTPLPGANPQPRVFLAAGPAGAGEPDNELMLLLSGDDKGFSVGEVIEVTALVSASRVAIVVTRVY